ncbi:MAG: small multi-drug export protein [Calditrichaeota bacterium]|nr:small multi-drug export protein [Calditrichota bacterium]
MSVTLYFNYPVFLIYSDAFEVFYKTFLNYSALIITQFILGKKASFLYALLFKMNLYIVSLVIIMCDLVLMLFVARLLSVTTKHVFPFTLLQREAVNREDKLKKSKLVARILKIGKLSPLIITAIPFSGGVWSGMLLSRILKLADKDAYWQVAIGSVIGCYIFLLAAMGLINLF